MTVYGLLVPGGKTIPRRTGTLVEDGLNEVLARKGGHILSQTYPRD